MFGELWQALKDIFKSEVTAPIEPPLTIKDKWATIPIKAPDLPPQCGLDLIKSFEKCRLVGYADQGGVATDGFGNTHGAQIGVAITQEKADADLARNVSGAWRAIQNLVKVPLTQNMAGSLLSFVFNVGVNAFMESSVLRALNYGSTADVPACMKKYNKVRIDGQLVPSQGLTNRRNAEVALFTGSDWRPA